MPRKLALLVGINPYPNFPPRNQLSSCADDVRLMAQVLQERFGFRGRDIARLCNEKATRRGILDALEDLGSQLDGEEDVVLFYYSGHGSRVRDQEGDEPDGWDETLVPHDSGRGEHPNRDIRDDEIYDWVLKVNRVTPYVTVILDSCKAGTAVRGIAKEKWVPADPRPLVPPGKSKRTTRRGALRDAGPSGWLPVSERYTLLAACRYSESAKEYEVPGATKLKHGAFTYFLTRELRDLPPGATYRDLMEKVRLAVNGVFPTQTPQVEGARDREVLGSTRIEPQRFLPVMERQGTRVVLGGGAAFGLTHGSEWIVYPPGTQRLEDATRPRGRVRVTNVRAVTSDAEVIEEANDRAPVSAGGRAVEAIHQEELRLPVVIRSDGAHGRQEDRVAPLVEALQSRIDASPLLRRVEKGRAAAVELRALGPGWGELEERCTEGCEDAHEPAWAMFGEDGALLVCPCPMFERGSIQRVIENLETRARFLHVLHLEDRDPANPLQGKLELTFLRRGPAGDWIPARPEGPEGEIVFREGEGFALELAHGFDRYLYCHVLDLGLTGGVGLLHPVPGEQKPLKPNRPHRIGVREGEGWTVGVPRELPAVEGRERIKVFATTHEADFGWLRQESYREAKKRSVLERLLGGALRGGELREAIPAEPPGDERWTAVSKSFLVRRGQS